jgi:hypothetical protein
MHAAAVIAVAQQATCISTHLDVTAAATAPQAEANQLRGVNHHSLRCIFLNSFFYQKFTTNCQRSK